MLAPFHDCHRICIPHFWQLEGQPEGRGYCGGIRARKSDGEQTFSTFQPDLTALLAMLKL